MTEDERKKAPKLPLRDKLLFAGKIVISAALLGLCIHYVDFQVTLSALGDVAVLPLIVAFVCATVGTVILPAFMTFNAMRIAGLRKSMTDLVVLNFSIRFYVIVLPRIASIWIRWRRLGDGALTGEAFALMAFERAVQMLTLCLLSAVALALEQDKLGAAGWVILQLSLVAMLISFLVLAAFLMPAAARILTIITARLRPILPRMISSKLAKLIEAVTSFRHLPKRTTGLIFWWSFIGFALFVLSSYIVAIALGLNISFVALTWVRSLVFLMTLMPLSVAGIGLREVGFVGLLGLYGISAADALAYSLANFALQLGMAVVGALIELRLLFTSGRRAGVQLSEGVSA